MLRIKIISFNTLKTKFLKTKKAGQGPASTFKNDAYFPKLYLTERDTVCPN